MDNLPERLRAISNALDGGTYPLSFSVDLDTAADELERLRGEREAYRVLAVSYAKTLRVSESNVDDIVRARLAQKAAKAAGGER